jgi:hypothetical protein
MIGNADKDVIQEQSFLLFKSQICTTDNAADFSLIRTVVLGHNDSFLVLYKVFVPT